jgi:hypothetical protein
MSLQTWVETLVTAQVAGTTLTGSTSATSIIPAAAKITLPTNYFYIGRMLRIRAMGQLGNIITTPGTITIDVRLGNVVAFNGGAMQLSSTAHTTLPFWLDIVLTCRAIGSGTSTNFMGQGIMTSQCLSLTAVADSTTTPATLLLPNTVPTVGTGFDNTVTNTLDLFATFSLSNANAITLQQYSVEAMN